MSETLPRSATAPNKIHVATPTTEQLHAIVHGEAPAEAMTTPDATGENRETSRSAGLLRRVANFLEQRAVNKAHSAALKEYRTTENEHYTDHVANLAESDNEAYQALGQKLLSREHRREDRAEFIDNATTLARNTGEAALSALQTTGEVAVGLGYLAGEHIYSSAKSAGEAVKDKAKNVAETGLLYGLEAVDTVKSVAETGVLYGMSAFDAAKEHAVATKDVVHMRLKEFAEVARNRRTARREKWAARKQAALEFVSAAKDKGLEVAGEIKDRSQELIASAQQEGQRVIGETASRAHAARAAGHAALEAYRSHTEQNKL